MTHGLAVELENAAETPTALPWRLALVGAAGAAGLGALAGASANGASIWWYTAGTALFVLMILASAALFSQRRFQRRQEASERQWQAGLHSLGGLLAQLDGGTTNRPHPSTMPASA